MGAAVLESWIGLGSQFAQKIYILASGKGAEVNTIPLPYEQSNR